MISYKKLDGRFIMILFVWNVLQKLNIQDLRSIIFFDTDLIFFITN